MSHFLLEILCFAASTQAEGSRHDDNIAYFSSMFLPFTALLVPFIDHFSHDVVLYLYWGITQTGILHLLFFPDQQKL